MAFADTFLDEYKRRSSITPRAMSDLGRRHRCQWEPDDVVPAPMEGLGHACSSTVRGAIIKVTNGISLSVTN